MRRIYSILVENQAGVLSRIAGLFGRRGYNIDSLSVGVTNEPGISRITVVVDADEYILEQIAKQLNKLVDVIKITDITEDVVERELVLIKVNAQPSLRNEILQIVDVFRGNVIDITRNSMTIECTGVQSKIEAMLEMLTQFGIIEMARTGSTALVRSAK